MLKKIAAFFAVIVLVLSTFIISGSAAYNPNYTNNVSFGRSYAVVWDPILTQYRFLDVNEGNPGNYDILTYDSEDYFTNRRLNGESILVDLWSSDLDLFVTIPLEKWSVDETVHYYCNVTVNYVPDDFENAYIFTFLATAASYQDYLYPDPSFDSVGLIFDDQNPLTTTLPYYLYAKVVSDPKSFPYYDGLNNYSSELENQYQLGYNQGQLNPNMDFNDMYRNGYNAGFMAGNKNVIEKNPVAGFLQGSWFGISQFFSIFLGQSTIFGVSLLTILSSLLVVLVVFFIVKKVF